MHSSAGFQIAEDIRLGIEKLKWEIEALFITVSGGVSCVEEKIQAKDFIKKADCLLYLAKNKGRNRIEM